MDGETSVARCQVASARAARALKFGIPAVLYGAGPHSLLEANGHRTDENLQLEDLRKNNEGGRAGAARSARHRATRPGLVAPWPPPSSYAKRSLVETGELRSGDMLDIDELRKWVGKSEQSVEQIAPFPSRALAATLDRNDPPYDAGSELPPLWAWMHFLSVSPLRDAGADGHPKRGGFLPPVPLPRRMWAGSRIEFVQPLRIGDVATKTSRILKVDHKSGRSGELVFVIVRHEYTGGSGLAINEEHDIVYREAPAPGTSAQAPPRGRDDATWRRTIHPDPVLLFRYSALTFNSHRIHYDLPYVTGEEGYAGLIVHGPLIATLLLDLLRREKPDATVRSFSFRAVSPLIAGTAFQVQGKPAGNEIELWAVNASGGLAMEGKAIIA